jgi:hypothetical protein
LQKGEHIYVCANWTRGAYLQIILVTESDDALIGEDEKEYHSGDVITEMTFGTNTSILITEASSPFASTNYTYLQYYSDSECTQPFSGSFAKPDDESTAVLYAKYIKGTYTIVRDRSGARDMFNYMRSKNYYFFNTSEEKVIDMSGVSLSLKTGTTEFDIKVEGNGFTLKNLSYSVTTVSTQNVIYSMFGKFTSDAEINNLNIENVNVTLTTVRPTVTSLSIYLVCNGAEEGTKFSNFAIGDITLEITTIRDTSNIVNMPKADGVYSTANSCFGGVANDEEFLSAHSGITVSNVTLQIGSN